MKQGVPTEGFNSRLRAFCVIASAVAFASVCFFAVIERGNAQKVTVVTSPTSFRIGEKLAYTVSYGKFADAAYAETHVVSRGKIGGKDAIEIRSKVKTLEMVAAAFFLFDEVRTVYAAPDTGLPLYVSTLSQDSAIPKETIGNYLTQPTNNFDLVTLLYKAREAGGVGTFPLFEDDLVHNATFATTALEKVKTDEGEFETTVSTVTSEFLTANGITNLKINFSTDEFRVPVLIRFKVAKNEFRALLSGITLPEVETPTPTPSPTPVKPATPTPKPTATPNGYEDNRPIPPELGFQVGESLDYQLTNASKPVATLNLSARERKQFNNVDMLVLALTVTAVEPGYTGLRVGDSVTARVNPETLAPYALEAKLATPFPGLNPLVGFDQRTGMINFGGAAPVEAPIGTHSIVSLIYAMRSFNLKPSKDRTNPVNDTRVAVFWESKAYVFTLRPSEPEDITLGGQKTSAQLITVTTLTKQLDPLAPKVWLSTEERVPIRFSLGAFQADLIKRDATLFR
ncbi:MAG: DUF3108 domain-containing protein [Pyrinomonadaceae bacterium]